MAGELDVFEDGVAVFIAESQKDLGIRGAVLCGAGEPADGGDGVGVDAQSLEVSSGHDDFGLGVSGEGSFAKEACGFEVVFWGAGAACVAAGEVVVAVCQVILGKLLEAGEGAFGVGYDAEDATVIDVAELQNGRGFIELSCFSVEIESLGGFFFFDDLAEGDQGGSVVGFDVLLEVGGSFFDRFFDSMSMDKKMGQNVSCP